MSDAETLRLRMKHQRDKLIDIIDSESGLLNILLKFDDFSEREIEKIGLTPSSYEKNEMLLNYVARTDKPEKLLEALSESLQTHVVNWIIADGEYRDEFGFDWPLTDKENRILRVNQASLVEILSPCELLNKLYSREVINIRQRDFIQSKPTVSDKNEALLRIIRRISLQSFHKLLVCLRDTKQVHVAHTLEFGGAIVPVHATLKAGNLDETETQLVTKLHDLLCSSTTTMEQESRVLAALGLKVIAVRRGESIVLYVKCCTEEEFNHLCKVVDKMEMKETLEKLFNLFLPSLKTKVMAVTIFERDIANAKESFAHIKKKVIQCAKDLANTAENIAATANMASTENEAMKRLRALSECCICLTTYTDPRMLPCFHSACLKCFEHIQLKNGKKPGDVLPCPLCRNEFQIPAVGMKGLQRNFFIQSLMEVTGAVNLGNKSRPCTTCSRIEDAHDIAEATMRCLNCCENYCLRCSKIHKTLKATKDHKIVELNIENNEEEIRNMFPIRKCVRHSDKVLDYYCSDCKTVVCVSCFVEDHKTHECKDVTTVDKEFRQRIEKSITEINYHEEDILSRKSDLERKKIDFLIKVSETESAIRKKNEELKALINQHTDELLNELSLLKQHQEKKIDAEIEEIERKLTVQESFVIYCTELKSKGSPSEVCISVDSLIARANELKKENDEYLRAPSKPFDFKFIATNQNAGNIIGELSESTKECKRSVVVVANSDAAVIMSLDRPEDVTAIEPLPDEFDIGAAAVYLNSIFVCGLGKKNADIWRLDSTSSKWRKCSSLIQGRQRHSVAFIDHVLYICGGWLSSLWEPLDDVETYDIFGDQCSKVGKLVYAVHSSCNCVPFGTSLYIFGGYNARNVKVRNIQVYDTRLNTCTLLRQQMPRACSWLRGELWENSVILLGKDGCFVYNFDTQTWKVRDKFKLKSSSSGVVVHDGKLFVIGCGFNSDEVRWIPVANILNDELIEWRHYANLPIIYVKKTFAFGKLQYTV